MLEGTARQDRGAHDEAMKPSLTIVVSGERISVATKLFVAVIGDRDYRFRHQL